MSIEVLGTDHVDLTVNDLERSTAFYDVILAELGFRRIPDKNDVIWANAHTSIGIYPAAPEERGAVHTRRRVGFHHLNRTAIISSSETQSGFRTLPKRRSHYTRAPRNFG